ncbi:MAG: hypothetical protein SAJ37_05845 [Oscillatoria sp. PMC 1068.18]|nr:hypothetical protein [Oscillatoria sp. PMC 1076.18]MEC4988254.1 hypothetical protein [Oscillatoria sp. PMC 1068.18]
MAFLTVLSFSQPAQALPFFDNGNPEQVDPGTVKSIQQKAEDFGGEDIGDTGLENIRELPENIPETTDLIIRQRSEDFEDAVDTVEEKFEKAAEKAKEAVD